MTVDHNQTQAWALCWPDNPLPLLYTSAEKAEANRKWFSKNWKTDQSGNKRGEPFVIVLGRSQLPESMSRDEMLQYYSNHANVLAQEAISYQKRILKLTEAAQAAWNCVAELPPTQARVEVAQMLQAVLEPSP